MRKSRVLNLLHVLIAVFFFQADGNIASAEGSISCARKDVSWSSKSFKNQNEFERFMPKIFDFPPPESQRFSWTKKDTAKRVNLDARLPSSGFGLSWALLDNGKLIGDAGHGFVVRYKCTGGATDYRNILVEKRNSFWKQKNSTADTQTQNSESPVGEDFFELGRVAKGTLEHCSKKNNRAGKIKVLYKQLEKKLVGLDALEFQSGITIYRDLLHKPENCSNETINKVRKELEDLAAVYKPSGRKASDVIETRFQSTFLTNYIWGKKSMEYLATAPREKVNLWTAPPPCPTRLFWWAWTPQDKFFEEHDDFISEFLDGWPKSTIEYCQNEIWLVQEGSTKSPEFHEKFWERSLATFFFRKGNQSFFTEAIIQQDLIVEKTGGKVFNKTLDEVCSFKLLDGDAVAINCPTLGTAAGVYEIEDYEKGIFKVFATSEDIEILATNISIEEFKQKYPQLK